ncbi:B12-binding domain-containing radical SAM protein [Solidesulfovibrio sp. C21]|uniref:B12-binding domain-containing radical SAM protein n=1 Tax=Solidesulfovibrio sp. C21 TaxID=3398613 RepID=UPI0039FDD786
MNVALIVPYTEKTGNVARDLVYGCWCKGGRIGGASFPPLPLLHCAGVLRQAGHRTVLVDAQAEGLSLAEVKQRIRDCELAVILTSTTTLNDDSAYFRELKAANPKLVTLAYGGHVTAEPESTLTDSRRRGCFDILARREAEWIIRDVATALEKGDGSWTKVNGIAYLEQDGRCIVRPDYPLSENLDDLPIADRTQLKPERYFNPIISRTPFTTMQTSRGCPGRCIFCASPYFYGRVERTMSADRVLEEIEYCTSLGYKEIFFRDENFTTIPERVAAICEGILARHLDVTWICSTRVTHVQREMMRLMRRAGCTMLRMGVESGNDEVLKRIGKGSSVEVIRQAFAWAQEVGLRTHAHMMIGLPGDTTETLDRTIAFINEIAPTLVTYGILTAYPGTPLFDSLRRKIPEIKDGTDIDLTQLHTQPLFNQAFCSLSNERLQWYVRHAYRSFYLRPRYLLDRLLEIRNPSQFNRYARAGLKVLRFARGGD